jgi:hypothetical protein
MQRHNYPHLSTPNRFASLGVIDYVELKIFNSY